MKNESYSKLSTVCNINESLLYFKYVEVFQSFPLQRNPIEISYTGNKEKMKDIEKAIKLVRGGSDVHNTAEDTLDNIDNADMVVCEASNTLLYENVRKVLASQKKDGYLILHLSELFDISTVQLLYLVTSCYTSVCIYTPMLHTGHTKFVVATHLHSNIELPPPPYSFAPNQLFLTKLIEINTMIGQKSLEQIRFNNTCEYECMIWKSKYLTGLHHVHVNTNGGCNQGQQRLKTAHGDAVY